MTDPCPAQTAARVERTAPSKEFTLREPEIRRLEFALKEISDSILRLRLELGSDHLRNCYAAVETLDSGLAMASSALETVRPADLRPDLSEAYLGQVVDDLLLVELTAREIDAPCSGSACRLLAEARRHLEGAVLSIRENVVVKS